MRPRSGKRHFYNSLIRSNFALFTLEVSQAFSSSASSIFVSKIVLSKLRVPYLSRLKLVADWYLVLGYDCITRSVALRFCVCHEQICIHRTTSCSCSSSSCSCSCSSSSCSCSCSSCSSSPHVLMLFSHALSVSIILCPLPSALSRRPAVAPLWLCLVLLVVAPLPFI